MTGDLEVYADSARLAQILRNLLSNAIRHNRPGGRITVHLQETRTRVGTSIPS